MTVGELKERLEQFDDNLIVMAGTSTSNVFSISNINQGAEPLTNILFLEGKHAVEEETNTARWLLWEGWAGNHDKRIEEATCSRCGYVHAVVRKTFGSGETNRDILNKLSPYCPACGAEMSTDY
jgi:ribosomal protein S27AE